MALISTIITRNGKGVDVKAVKEFAGKVFGQGNVVEVVMTSESQE
jgi:hypothetical protein